MLSRRQLLQSAAALPGFATGAATQEPYRLGVMAGMYSGIPLDDAMTRIRKAGYRYVSLVRKHADDIVYSPELTKPQRSQMLRRIRDLGVQPFLSLGGFAGGDLHDDASVQKCVDQLDLCADYEIPVMVGAGPWYYKKFPNLPKRDSEWQEEVSRFYVGLEKALRHAEQVRVLVALKPHTGITARGRDCLQVLKRMQSPWLKIAWDAGNISFYEGIYPDPDLPDVAASVKAVCIKDHSGLRGDENFPIPGQGNVDHELMFRTLFPAGFNGPIAIERLDGKDGFGSKAPADVVDKRIIAARDYLVPLLDRLTARG